ncbi:hypothetical protein CP97_14702 [Aurantiacibacter atlanticus]|uniref:Uncharacterized protein n=1 Tax=Aurantiacibacter atlanticus TaxID=1648404 RepID=A0A168M153_9SPHN|nr:hypothetical protein CP97_14702 [Aurantiacibacter atlanticus]
MADRHRDGKYPVLQGRAWDWPHLGRGTGLICSRRSAALYRLLPLWD